MSLSVFWVSVVGIVLLESFPPVKNRGGRCATRGGAVANNFHPTRASKKHAWYESPGCYSWDVGENPALRGEGGGGSLLLRYGELRGGARVKGFWSARMRNGWPRGASSGKWMWVSPSSGSGRSPAVRGGKLAPVFGLQDVSELRSLAKTSWAAKTVTRGARFSETARCRLPVHHLE